MATISNVRLLEIFKRSNKVIMMFGEKHEGNVEIKSVNNTDVVEYITSTILHHKDRKFDLLLEVNPGLYPMKAKNIEPSNSPRIDMFRILLHGCLNDNKQCEYPNLHVYPIDIRSLDPLYAMMTITLQLYDDITFTLDQLNSVGNSVDSRMIAVSKMTDEKKHMFMSRINSLIDSNISRVRQDLKYYHTEFIKIVSNVTKDKSYLDKLLDINDDIDAQILRTDNKDVTSLLNNQYDKCKQKLRSVYPLIEKYIVQFDILDYKLDGVKFYKTLHGIIITLVDICNIWGSSSGKLVSIYAMAKMFDSNSSPNVILYSGLGHSFDIGEYLMELGFELIFSVSKAFDEVVPYIEAPPKGVIDKTLV